MTAASTSARPAPSATVTVACVGATLPSSRARQAQAGVDTYVRGADPRLAAAYVRSVARRQGLIGTS